jgi:aerobic carbon-monoxide dehydrogenase medium subunit
MIPRFSLARPRTLDEAWEALAAAGGEGTYYAGGTELLQVMKMGLAQFGTLVDLKGIKELRGVAGTDGGSLRIGGAATHREIERSPVVRERLPALARLEEHVANVRVRNQGTLGGNLCFAEPHSDPATFLLAAGAEVELAGPNGRRRLGIADFVLGPLFTDRSQDEVLVAVHVPERRPGQARGYAKVKFFERPAASVAVSVDVTDDGTIGAATVAAGSLTEIPVAVPAAGEALVGLSTSPDDPDNLDGALAPAREALAELDAVDDLNGSADYKRHLAGILLGRALRDALLEVPARA